MRLFFAIFFGVLAAGICLYFFTRWQRTQDALRVRRLKIARRPIGFGAIIAETKAS